MTSSRWTEDRRKKWMSRRTIQPVKMIIIFPFGHVHSFAFTVLTSSWIPNYSKRKKWAAQTRALGSCFTHRLVLCHFHGTQFSISDTEVRYDSPFIKLTWTFVRLRQAFKWSFGSVAKHTMTDAIFTIEGRRLDRLSTTVAPTNYK